jgi:AcrR family transcriptional regulator
MRQIAEAAHIALGGIYNHFASKELLFVQVLLEHHPIHAILPELQAADGATLHDFVADVAARLVRRFEERLDFLNVMFIELVEFEGRHLDELFDLIFPQTLAFGHRLLRWEDELRPIPVPLLVRAFMGFFYSYVITEFLIGRHFTPDLRQGALEQFIRIFLFGISKGSPDELATGSHHP